MSKSREQINHFLNGIDIEGKLVLDVGVQNNPASNYCKGKASVYKTLDIDGQWNPDFVNDLNDYVINKNDLSFDIVFCMEVLEHVWNPINALKNLYKYTKENGVCYISVPFINPIHDKWDYLRYTPEWFKKVLPRVGFKDIKITNRMASVGQCSLSHFYTEEGLKFSKIRKQMGDSELINLIGVIVEARK